MKFACGGLRAAVEDQLEVLNRPQVEGDAINGIKAKAGCPPFDPLSYCIIGGKEFISAGSSPAPQG